MNTLKKIIALALAMPMLFCTACSDKNKDGGDESETGLITGGDDDEILRIDGLSKKENDVSTLKYEKVSGMITILGCNGRNGILKIPSEIEGCPVTSIGDNAFINSGWLYEVSIPDSVEYLGDWAFKNCVNLEKISLPENFGFSQENQNYIGVDAFEGTAWLENYPDDYPVLGDGILYKLKGTSKDVRLPEGIKKINNSMFLENNVETLYIPASLTSFCLGSSLSSDMDDEENSSFALPLDVNKSIEVSPDNAYFSSRDGVLYNKAGDTLLYMPLEYAQESFVVPSDVKTLARGAFSVNTTISSITLPAGLVSVSTGAFSGCDALENVKIPEGVQYICESAFSYCEAIKEIEIPASVKRIDSNCFSGCTSLTKVRLSEGLEEIGYGAFAQCENLAEINIPKSLKLLPSDAVNDTQWYSNFEGKTAIVGDGIMISYAGDMKNVVIPAGVKSFGGYFPWRIDMEDEIERESFVNTFESITLPDGLEHIGTDVFYRCGMKKIRLPKSLKTMGAALFYNASLEEIEIPAGVEEIPYCCFSSCLNLSRVVFANNSKLKRIDRCAFDNAQITELKLPAGVEELCAESFSYCTQLKKISFADNAKLKIIQDMCFTGCTELEEIVIPASVEIVGEDAFYNCSKLKKVSFEEGSRLITVGANAFSNTLLEEGDIRFPEGVLLGEGLFKDDPRNTSNG